ncbi:ATP-binding protein [Streptomyces sp. NPDC002851]
MKQSAAKTLGVAALGAAFAAAGTGAASAAPDVVTNGTTAANTVADALSVEGIASKALPPGGQEAMAAGQMALAHGLSGADPMEYHGDEAPAKEDKTSAKEFEVPAQGSADPVNQMLGGLSLTGQPTQDSTSGMVRNEPMQEGVPSSGLPLRVLE